MSCLIFRENLKLKANQPIKTYKENVYENNKIVFHLTASCLVAAASFENTLEVELKRFT